jgi:acyl-CoA thioesterase FadM
VEIHLLVREKTRKTITYDFRFLKADREPVARGSVKIVCVAIDADTKQMSAIPIPHLIDEKIEQAPAEILKGRE